jgi:hypothetical protein
MWQTGFEPLWSKVSGSFYEGIKESVVSGNSYRGPAGYVTHSRRLHT